MKLVECVPNISEGRDAEKIGKIVAAAARVKDVAVLHVDSNIDANRTVVTMAGTSDAISEAAFQMTAQAYATIDMEQHSGVHPRIGAVDVCPFIPLAGSSIAECVEISTQYAMRVASEFSIPVFLYEKSAATESRVSLSDIRRGEYEGLKAKLQQEHWVPDFGPAEFNKHIGALVTGARPFLIAYNVNLKGLSLAAAKRIAARIRTSGRWIPSSLGESQHIPGELPACKAIGWTYPNQGVVQVSTNITDFSQNQMHAVYNACQKWAIEFGGDVAGSELIGLVPMEALVSSGRHYAGDSISTGEAILAAIEKLGLDSLSPFSAEERIIEIQLEKFLFNHA